MTLVLLSTLNFLVIGIRIMAFSKVVAEIFLLKARLVQARLVVKLEIGN